MKKFIERDKLSKKARKELDSRQRITWDVKPVTSRVESKKLYNRKRKPIEKYGDSFQWAFVLSRISFRSRL